MAEVGFNLRAALFELGQDALKAKGKDLKKRIEDYKKDAASSDAKGTDTGKAQELQFHVGEYSNLSQTITNMEKMMKDTIAAAARNTS